MINTISLISARGDTLTVHTSGRGPALLLLHGFPLDARMWAGQIEHFSKSYHVLTPNFRGFGGSRSNSPEWSMEDLADDIETIRQHLAHGQKIILGGLSMGGYVCFEYWSRYREHLAALLLFHTNPFTDTDEVRQNRLKVGEQATAQGSWEATRPMLDKLLAAATAQNRPEIVEQVERMMREGTSEGVCGSQRAMADRSDYSNRLNSIDVPTLVVSGDEDRLATPAKTAAWANEIPTARSIVIEQAGHLSPIEQPLQFNAHVEDFFRNV
jgi:3-oxoadipate enol-lactonase